MMDSLGITQADLDNLDEQLGENGMFELGRSRYHASVFCRKCLIPTASGDSNYPGC